MYDTCVVNILIIHLLYSSKQKQSIQRNRKYRVYMKECVLSVIYVYIYVCVYEVIQAVFL